MACFWKFRFYKFQPQRKKNKKKSVESRYIRLMFLSRSTERQAGQYGKTCYWLIDSKKSWINQHFLRTLIFVYLFLRNMNCCAYLACIYFRECLLKENFACIWFCEIDQHLWDSRKYVRAEIRALKVRFSRKNSLGN